MLNHLTCPSATRDAIAIIHA